MRTLDALISVGHATALAVVVAIGLVNVSLAAVSPAQTVGESIYRHGFLGSGASLKASRGSDMHIAGGEAACVNCHQRSGLGAKEGGRVIPPIAGRYLFRPRAREDGDQSLPYVEGMRGDREPYTEVSLARAIRDGVDSEGRSLDYLMPRFDLSDADMSALITYLKGLVPDQTPGVSETVLHFATIVTPDADPIKARGMLDVLKQFFVDKNAFPVGPTPRLQSSRKMMFMANRRWQLHVWMLSGPPAEWPQQLERHLKEEPVLAVISGIGGTTWAPIQRFCEAKSLPCLFPNTEAPPMDADENFYSMYFSKGVLLEAELIASRLLERGKGHKLPIIRQVYRVGDRGETGALALAAALKKRGVPVKNEVLPQGSLARDVATGTLNAKAADAWVLWLRPADLSALDSVPVSSKTIYLSGLLGGLEHSPLPASWRDRTLISYPFDLPAERRVRVDFARGWFSIRRIPVVDEQIQTDTYLACGLLAETLSHMADTFVREYLVERVVEVLEHRILTGYYPHLSLATGQRFASKGGFFVRFAKENGDEIVPDSAWIRP